ncbi:MAG: DNA gyrase inhibitor YacG [Planctomycetota bacterium]
MSHATDARPRKMRCPVCRREFTFVMTSDVPTFPFCSATCKTQDLGSWLGGDYMITSSLVTGEARGGPDPDAPVIREDLDSGDDYDE